MSTDLVVREEAGLLADDVLQPVMSLQLAKQRLAEFQAFVKEYLREDEDYGTIPGTPKPTLYKPGADKLCELYGLSDSYEIVDKVEDFESSLFDYTIRCVLTRIRTQLTVSTGLGSCNSYEGRYRWREGQRKCPKCQKESIIKGKEEYGGGWLCFAKKGGCGAKFADGDPSITGQVVGRIENDDIATLKNTILKMAKKRAKIDATLAATRSSGIFTQDIEDFESNVPSTAPKKTSPASAKVQDRPTPKPVGQVMCGECRKVNGHDPECKYAGGKPKSNQEVVPTKQAYMVTAVAKKQSKKKGEYLTLAVKTNVGDGLLYVWRKSLFEHFTDHDFSQPVAMIAEISEQKTDDGKVFYSVEHLIELGLKQFVDDKLAEQAEVEGVEGLFVEGE